MGNYFLRKLQRSIKMKIITERTISRTDKVTERRILEIPDKDFIHFTREYCAQNGVENPYCDEIQLYPTQKQGVSASNLHFSEEIGREFDAFLDRYSDGYFDESHDNIHDILYSGNIAENIYSDNISDIEFEARLAERREMIDHQRKIRYERKARAEKRKRQRIYSAIQKTTGAAMLAGTIAGGIMVQDITFGAITIPISLLMMFTNNKCLRR